MTETKVDLVIRTGRVVCLASGVDGPGAVAIRGDRIVAAGPDITGEAEQTLEFPDAVVLPGLIDLHAHPACEGSKYGVDPDVEFLPRGVTTVASQGDAGAKNWNRYRRTTLDVAQTRVRMALNLSARGESMDGGCFEDMDDVDVDACVATIQQAGDLIWAIAVNVSRLACGDTDPREVAARAREAAERTGKPILYGIRDPADWPIEEQFAFLQPGDVVTYCFRNEPYRIAGNGTLEPVVLEARRRGVLFDVGHGMASFSFDVAEAAIAADFAPDTISTDGYRRHVGQRPPHDLPRTMSKLLAVGMAEADVFAAVTSRPAKILGLADEIGSLAPGACGDVVVLGWNESAAPLVDTTGTERAGGCYEPLLTVRGGTIVPTSSTTGRYSAG